MEVEPVREFNDVKRMYHWLKDNVSRRDAECWLIGCNIALRAGDLLQLRFDQFEQGQETVVIREQKSGFRKEIPIVPEIKEAVIRLREYYSSIKPYKTKDFEPAYLFQSTSRRAYHLCQPVCIQWLSMCYKKAAAALELGYNLNTHSMRKTWGYHAYNNGADISYIQALLNHREQYTTLRYIGVTRDSVSKMLYDNQMNIAG